MNQYHIYEELSRRKGSVLYKGRVRNTISYVGVKGVEKEFQYLAENEVKLMYNLNHPNILKFVNWYATSKHIWVIMEYCTGGTLREILSQDVALPDDCIRVFARSLCSALYFIHCRGIMYCDLKPANIVFDDEGTLKLGDFSFAQLLNADGVVEEQPSLSGSGGHSTRRGSPYYMAPELFKEDQAWSVASDIWSLGCVMFEMANGKPPYTNRDITQLMQALLTPAQTPPVLPTSPGPSHVRCGELIDLVAHCLHKDPSKRATWSFIFSHPFWADNPPDYDANALPRVPAPTTMTRQVSTEEMLRFSENAYRNSDHDDHGDVALDKVGHATMIGGGWDVDVDFGEVVAPSSPPATPAKGTQSSSNLNVPPTPSAFGLHKVHNVFSEDDYSPNVTPLTSPMPHHHRARTARQRSPDVSPLLPRIRARTAPRAAQSQDVTPSAMNDEMSQLDSKLRTMVVEASDLVVRPLVDNARIQKVVEPVFNTADLPCKPCTAEEVVQFNEEQLDNFLCELVNGMKNVQNMVGCEACLSYFQVLCKNQNVATKVVNSGVGDSMLDILQMYTSPSLKSYMLYAIGLEIRFATTINATVDYVKLLNVLCDHVRHEDVSVRGWAMAALGELLFYVTIEMSSLQWRIDPRAFQLVSWCLRDGENSIVQHYALKTIENICAQSGPMCSHFCEDHVIENALTIYDNTRRSALKRTAGTVIFQLAYRSVPMLERLLKQRGAEWLYSGLSHRSVHLQRTFLNLLNILLLNRRHVPHTVLEELVANKSLIPRLLKLAEHSLTIIRSKVVISLCLIGQTDMIWLHECLHNKCMPLLERLRSDSNDDKKNRIAGALTVFADLSGVWTQRLLSTVVECLNGLLEVSHLSGSQLKVYHRNARKFKIVNYFLLSSVTRVNIINDKLLRTFARLLLLAEKLKFAESVQWKRSLLATVEALSSDQSALRQNASTATSVLFPRLLAFFENDSAELRFTSLKVLSDGIIRMVRDAHVYNEHESEMNEFIVRQLLPKFPSLLQDAVPAPQYCMKLLCELVDTRDDFIRVVHELGLTPQLLTAFAPVKNNSVYNVNLIRHLVASPEVNTLDLVDRGLLSQLYVVLEYALDNGISWYHELLLNMIHDLLASLSTTDAVVSDQSIDELLLRYESLLSVIPLLHRYLTMKFSAAVRIATIRCLVLLARLYPSYQPSFVEKDRLRVVFDCLRSSRDIVGLQNVLLEYLTVLMDSTHFQQVLASNEALASDMATLMNDVASRCLSAISPSDHSGVTPIVVGMLPMANSNVSDSAAASPQSVHSTRLKSAELAHALQQFATNCVFEQVS